MKKTVAVLLTVFNRKDITLKGLSTLYVAMKPVEDKYSFDVYMTNDGCTDGTPEAVKNCFPDVHIINGDGNLYWSGGMRKAWDVAAKTHYNDYYLQFNDDAILYENSLEMMFEPFEKDGEKTIVSGAFCDDEGNISYGGRNRNNQYVIPNGTNCSIYLMNGNLVLIPRCVYDLIGNISKDYHHSFGDWDYGIRALRKGIHVLLTAGVVGSTNRHDSVIPAFIKGNTVKERVDKLYSPLFSVLDMWHFRMMDKGILYSIIPFFLMHIYAICPKIYYLTHN